MTSKEVTLEGVGASFDRAAEEPRIDPLRARSTTFEVIPRVLFLEVYHPCTYDEEFFDEEGPVTHDHFVFRVLSRWWIQDKEGVRRPICDGSPDLATAIQELARAGQLRQELETIAYERSKRNLAAWKEKNPDAGA